MTNAGFAKTVRWLGIAALAWTCSAYAKDLVILNWADYIDPAVVAEFEKQADVKVRFIYFNSDEARDDYLVEQGTSGIDLAVVDNTAVKPYARRGWILPVSDMNIPNLQYIAPKWSAYYPGNSKYGVPYAWGTLGIVYRRDVVKPKPTSWMDLLRPKKAYYGRILMIDDSVELVSVALKALGYSMNDTRPQRLKQAQALLLKQRPAVRAYRYFAMGKKSPLITGSIVMAMAYNGDASKLVDMDKRIGFVVPKEGGSLWVDYLVVMRKAPHAKLAAQFINFLNQPEIAARNTEYTYAATANIAAERLLPKDIHEDPLVYPPPAVLKHCEPYAVQPPAVRRRINTIFANVVR